MASVLILLIIAFLVFPLLQQLIRAAQNAAESEPERPEELVAEIPMRERPLRANAEDSLPADEAMVLGPVVPPRNVVKILPPAMPRSARRIAVVAGRRRRIDLRQAIVAMTVVGPCRAAQPYDSGE